MDKILISLLFFGLSQVSFAQPQSVDPILESHKYPGTYGIETLYEKERVRHESGSVEISPEGKWKVKMRLGFWGAYLFSMTTAEEKAQLQAYLSAHQADIKHAPDNSLFELKSYTRGKTVSLGNHAKMKEIIITQMKNVSRMLSAQKNDFGLDIQFEIEPVFIDEAAMMKKFDLTQVNTENVRMMNTMFSITRFNFHPITILPVPISYAVSTDYWDIYSRPEFLAHETVHMLTRLTTNDQFAFSDAPFDGLTNDGDTYRELEKMGYEPKLDLSLFLAFVQNQETLAKVFGPQPKAYTGFSGPFKKYMNSDSKGNYSEELAVFDRNFNIKKQKFIKSKSPKRQIPLKCTNIFL